MRNASVRLLMVAICILNFVSCSKRERERETLPGENGRAVAGTSEPVRTDTAQPTESVPRGTTMGLYNPANSTFLLRYSNRPGFADNSFQFGKTGDEPVVGDWNGDGWTRVGVFRSSTTSFLLSSDNKAGAAGMQAVFGKPGDIPLAGDWDGNGTSTIGVYRPANSTFYLRNSNSSGPPDVIVTFGEIGDLPVVGDWDGDRVTTIGVYRQAISKFFLKNRNTAGPADLQFRFETNGDASHDVPIAGDWDGDGRITVGVFRPSTSTFYFTNKLGTGFAESSSTYGVRGHLPVVGHWAR